MCGTRVGRRHVAAAVPLVMAMVACSSGAATPASAGATSPAATAAASSPAPPASATPGATASASASPRRAATVTLANFMFEPSTLTVPIGTTVTFVNADVTDHTASEGKDGLSAPHSRFDLRLPRGGRASFTFTAPGTYAVTCRIHPTMNMTIVVR